MIHLHNGTQTPPIANLNFTIQPQLFYSPALCRALRHDEGGQGGLPEREGRRHQPILGRPVVFGDTSTGRHLMVVYEEIDADTVYPVTAYDVPRRQRP